MACWPLDNFLGVGFGVGSGLITGAGVGLGMGVGFTTTFGVGAGFGSNLGEILAGQPRFCQMLPTTIFPWSDNGATLTSSE